METKKEESVEQKTANQPQSETKESTTEQKKVETTVTEAKEVEKVGEIPEIKIDKKYLDEIINHPEKFGLEEQREITTKLSALEEKILYYAKDETTKPITEKLYDLQEKLEELNPATYENAPIWKKILGLVPQGDKLIRYIAEKYENVKEYIENIMKSLSDAKDRLIRDNIELENLEKELQNFNKELEEKIRLGKKLVEEIKKRLANAKDPFEKEKLENALFILSSRLQDLQTMLQANLQFLVSIRKTLTNNKMLLASLERTQTVTRTVLMVGLAIRGALLNQKKAIESVQATQDYTAQILKENAEAIKSQSQEIERLYTEPVIAMKKLEEAYNTLISAIQDYETIRRKGIQIAQENIQKLEQMNRKLKEKLGDKE